MWIKVRNPSPKPRRQKMLEKGNYEKNKYFEELDVLF
jgi:hypothetical protein